MASAQQQEPEGIWEDIQAIARRFAQAWLSGRQSGQRPSLRRFLAGAKSHPRFMDLAVLLARTDLNQRLLAGDDPPLEELLRVLEKEGVRLDGTPHLRLIRLEYDRRWWRGEPGVSRAEYQERFPEYRAVIANWTPLWTCPACKREDIPLPDEGAATVTCPNAHCPNHNLAITVAELFRVPAYSAQAGLDVREYVFDENEDRIGEGGMGGVYRSRDPGLGRELALKVIRKELHDSREGELRFVQEAKVTSRLEHPNIVPVHSIGRLRDGRLFYTMKLVRGQTLEKKLAACGAGVRARLGACLDDFERVCQAVAYAHQQAVIHRDLKPSNVMVGEFGQVQVMDWGLAKRVRTASLSVLGETAYGGGSPLASRVGDSLPPQYLLTQAGRFLGTLLYAAPEQVKGATDLVGKASDVFALGALLCEILTGYPPYQGAHDNLLDPSLRNQIETLVHSDTPWPGIVRLRDLQADPEVSPHLPLIQLADECLARAPASRPHDAGVVAKRVEEYQKSVRQRAEDERVQREKSEEAEKRAEAEHQAKNQAVKRAEEQSRRARVERQKRRLTVLFASFILLTLIGSGLAFGLWWKNQVERQVAEEHRAALSEEDLTQAEESLRREEWDQSKQILERAGGRLEWGAPDSLRLRYQTLHEQFLFVQELEKLRERGLVFDGIRSRAIPLGAQYVKLFHQHGMRFGKQQRLEIAEQIMHSPVRMAIIQSLHHWFGNDKANRKSILAVLDQVDAKDTWRVELRKAIYDGNLEKTPEVDIKEMRSHDLRCLIFLIQGNPELIPPVPRLGYRQKQIGPKALRDGTFLVRRLQETYPGDFWFNLFSAASSLTSRSRRQQEGVGYARAALSLRPESPWANYLVGYLLLEKAEDVDGAIRYFKRAIELDPSHIASHTGLGIALERNKNLPDAVEAHQRAIALNPLFAVPYCNLASTLKAKEDVEGALKAVYKALELDPDLGRAHNNLGMLLKDKGDREGAVRHLKKAIDLDPEDAVAHFNLGAVLREGKNLKGAIAAYRKAVVLDPGYARAHNNLGSALDEQGDYAGAVRAYETAIALDSTEALYWSNLGETLRTKRELDGAIRAFRRAIELDSKGPVYHNNLGSALQEMGDWNGAIVALSRAVELDPKFATAHVNYGVALLKRGRTDNAVAVLQKAVAIDPGSAHAYYNLGSAFLAKRNLDKGIEAFNTSIELDSKFAPAYNDLATALRQKGNLQQAKTMFERATEISPKFAPAYINLGDLLLQLNDVEGAIRACRGAVAIDSKSVEAYNNLGAALHTKKDWEGAISAYDTAIRIAPDNTTLYKNLANTFVAKGEVDKAIALWRKVVKIDPKDGSIQLGLAVQLIHKKDFDGAIAVLNPAIEALPGNGALYRYLGYSLIQKGKWEDALLVFRRGVKVDPENEGSQTGLANCLQKKGDFSEAITAWREVVRINPKNGDGWFALATCCRTIGQFKEAVQAFEKAETYGSIIPGYQFPPETLQSVRKLVELEAKLDRVLAKEEKPRDAKEMATLAFLCREYKQRYLAATRFYSDAFKESPELADDPRSHRRFEAACAAVLASGRKGKDASELPDEEQPRLRAQALAWLKPELAFWTKQLANEKTAIRDQARRTLEGWQKTTDLAEVREAPALQNLSPAERTEWRTFWEEVSKLLASANSNK